MRDWWKVPVLQGPENDYGDYDYLIEEIPQDSAKWELDKYRWKCDDCGKDRHLRFVTRSYFHTLDGWDEMSWATCWRCEIKSRFVHARIRLVNGVNKRIKRFKYAIELYNICDGKLSFKRCYKFAKELYKN